jgi:hypothetical protein
MEIIIYLIGGIIRLAIVLVIPICLLYGAYLFGKKYKIFHLEIILPLSLLIISSLWITYSYQTFSQLCNKIPNTSFYSFPELKPNGFMVYYLERHSLPGNFSGHPALESGAFEWMEIRGKESRNLRTEFHKSRNIKHSKLNEGFKSNYIFKVMPLTLFKEGFFAPIYLYKVQLTERLTGKILAEASELVFGGGILGSYMGLIEGDQDFRYHSCGYVSQKIGPWRPTLSTRPLSKGYYNTDKKFIIRALSSANN